jgi:ParB-like chromosome segregation protein Spo0J
MAKNDDRPQGAAQADGAVTLQPHPAAQIFPLMTAADISHLVDDIKENGQREPIVIHDGMILDGRNRYAACLQIGIEPRKTVWNGAGTPEAFVIAKNLHRRHLTQIQRTAIAIKLANMVEGRPKKETSAIALVSQKDAAKLLDVSVDSMKRLGVVQNKGAAELVQAVEDGRISVSTAALLVDLSKPRQREIVKGGKRPVTKAARRMRRERQGQRSRRAESKPAVPEMTSIDFEVEFLQRRWECTSEPAKAVFLERERLVRLPNVISPPGIAGLPMAGPKDDLGHKRAEGLIGRSEAAEGATVPSKVD